MAQRQKLKLQFAKADRDRDGFINSFEFNAAVQGATLTMPALAKARAARCDSCCAHRPQVPWPAFESQFQAHVGPKGLDIAGFIKIIEKLHQPDERPPLPPRAAVTVASPASEDDAQPARRRISKLLTDNVAAHTIRAATGVGKWFGVAGSPETMQQWHVAHEDAVGGRRNGRLSAAYGRRAQQIAMQHEINMLDDSDEEEKPSADTPMIADPDQALAHYRGYVSRERAEHKKMIEPGWQQNGPPRRESKAKFDNIDFDKLQTRKKLELNRLLDRLPDYHSFFISAISLVQLILFIVMFGLSYKHQEIAPFNLATSIVHCTPGSTCPVTFACETCFDSNATQQPVSNLWYGPNLNVLLRWGAKFTPCMRRDTAVYTALAQVRTEECGVYITNTCALGNQFGYSCCTLSNFRSGMTSNKTCHQLKGHWQWPNQLCSAADNIVLRPCCTGFTGTCALLTEQQCSFEGGTYYMYNQLCSEINCLSASCQSIYGSNLTTDPLLINVPEQPDQFWRVFTAMLTHAGLIQLIVAVGFQYHLGVDIERKIGTLRVMIIYIGAGIGGFMVSSIFETYQITNGCDTPVFGLVALLIVDVCCAAACACMRF